MKPKPTPMPFSGKPNGQGDLHAMQGMHGFHKRAAWMICIFLIGVTTAVYWPVGNHEFIHLDDLTYVTQNPHVKAGLTPEAVAQAFSTTRDGNWFPLTWLSHMLDFQIYGLHPGSHHVTNLIFHLGNTLLLFLIFLRMTGKPWQSGFVASLFALHPLHVESVAWVSERKDVLSTLFWMLTIWAQSGTDTIFNFQEQRDKSALSRGRPLM